MKRACCTLIDRGNRENDHHAFFGPHLLLEHVEVVDDDSDEEVEREEGSADDEDDEVEVVVDGGLPLRLLVDLARVHRVRHNLHPALERGLRKKFDGNMSRVRSGMACYAICHRIL